MDGDWGRGGEGGSFGPSSSPGSAWSPAADPTRLREDLARRARPAVSSITSTSRRSPARWGGSATAGETWSTAARNARPRRTSDATRAGATVPTTGPGPGWRAPRPTTRPRNPTSAFSPAVESTGRRSLASAVERGTGRPLPLRSAGLHPPRPRTCTARRRRGATPLPGPLRAAAPVLEAERAGGVEDDQPGGPRPHPVPSPRPVLEDLLDGLDAPAAHHRRRARPAGSKAGAGAPVPRAVALRLPLGR